MRLTPLRCAFLLLMALLSTLPARAQPAIPAALEPWRDWVLYQQEFRTCPVMNGTQPGQPVNHVCAWPGTLAVDVEADGARFDITWTVYAQTWIPLPGSARIWPTGVLVDGADQPVVDRAGVPSVRLAAGTRRISGRLGWVTRPASLPVPTATGLVGLVLDGVTVANPTIEDGTLWLGLREGAEAEQDRLDVQVYRLLTDGVPIRLETRIRLDVAGQAREQALRGVLPAGVVGEALTGPLPAVLDPDGALRVQLRPGSFELRLTAHAERFVDQIVLDEATAPWPEREIVSFASAPRLRVAVLEGLQSIDGGQAGVPREWQTLPAFAAQPGDTMTLVERSRNDASAPNRLRLVRDMWLDFDGAAYTALDRVSGSMGNGWRLDMAAPYVMTMAEIDAENLLVTEGPAPGLQGVELRETEPVLTATARVPAAGRLAVSGYAERFDGITTMLHLPPSYRLMAAFGADSAAGAWSERWRLLDLFVVLISTVAAWRLFGPLGGIVALAALVLTYHEPSAPRWAWLNVLLAIAVFRVAPAGRLRTWAGRYRAVSLAAVGLLLIPFLIVQLRVVIYPQLEYARLGSPAAPGFAATALPEAAAPGLGFGRGEGAELDQLLERVRRGEGVDAADLQRLREFRTSLPSAVEEVVVTGARIAQQPLTRFQPGALVQTGPGLPDWAWNRYVLLWNGPVEIPEEFRPLIFSPWLLQLWRIAGAALVLAFAAVLLGRDLRVPGGWRRGTAAAGAVLLALVLLPGGAGAQATAEFPSEVLLNQLRDRLIEPAPCHPQCATLANAAVELDGDRLTLALEIETLDTVAVPLPVASEGWRAESVRVDGADLGLVYRSPDGRSWTRVESGVHRLELAGGVAPVNSFTLDFPLPPRTIAVDASGWDVAGVVEGLLPSGALELVRQRGDADGDEAAPAATVFPPYVRVTRRVTLDLDWTVRTVVERIAPADVAFTLGIDLLPDESVLTPGIEVEDGRAVAAFTAVQPTVVWESRLPLADTLTLTAPATVPWAESWEYAVSPMWHAEYMGLPASPPEFRGGTHMPTYFPRPGEALTVDVTRPAPASGDTIAIDTVEYEFDVGDRSGEAMLYFEYRSTQGGEHTLLLPDGSELEEVMVDGSPVPLELDGNRLELQKSPGEHDIEVRWRQPAGVGFAWSLPIVDLGGGASNLYSNVSLPQDRWVLFSSGPTLGPAFLYWPELVVFVLAALVLGRVPYTPLRTHEWLLLGLGLSTFAWPVLFAFAVWAFVLAWRERTQLGLGRHGYNAVQAGLAVLTIGTIVALVTSIPQGLLGVPDMQIRSPVPGSGLNWFSDRSAGLTDPVTVVSVSLWFYKAVMLAWALWLSFALLRWLRWAWTAFSHEGIWRGKVVPAGK